jgi:multidrug efflux pump
VIAISLILSWIVAVIFTPFIAYYLPQRADARDDAGEPDEQYEGRFYGWFRRLLDRCLERRKTVVGLALTMFIASMLLFQIGVPRQFFPASDRPELVVDLQVAKCQLRPDPGRCRADGELLATDKRILSVTSYVGGIAALLPPLNVQTPDITLAELVLQTRDEEAREAVIGHIQGLFATHFPEARGRVSRLENGPSVGQPLQYRVAGPALAQIIPSRTSWRPDPGGQPCARREQ